METTTGKRIQQLRKAKSLSVQALAEMLQVKASAIYGLESDANKPSYDTITGLTINFPDLNPDWLLTGTGSMLREGRNLTPFVPGGEVNKQGGTRVPEGGLAKALPLGNLEDMDAAHRPAAEPAPTASNAKEFIAGLLREIDGHKVEKENLRNQLDKVYRALEESQRSNRVCQEQLSLLLGKSSGNQYAPGTFAPVMHVSPAEEIDEAQALEEGCVVHPILTAPARQRRMHKVVAEYAA